jgi:hypothetical protein
MGVSATMPLLAASHDREAQKALAYITECNDTGDFDDLESYYNENT